MLFVVDESMYLRPLANTPEDKVLRFAILSQKSTRDFDTRTPVPEGDIAIDKWWADFTLHIDARAAVEFVIMAESRPVGTTAIYTNTIGEVHVGWALLEAEQGKKRGLAAKATEALFNIAFATSRGLLLDYTKDPPTVLAINEIVADIPSDHAAASIKIGERIGMKPRGEAPPGSTRYSITRTDWETRSLAT